VARIIGIDLGTTNSCVAVFESGAGPRVLAGSANRRTTPSVVAYTGERNSGDVLVGEKALRQAVTNPKRTVFGAKRLIGRKVNAKDVGWFARTAPFRIVSAPNGDAWVRVDDTPISPQEVASHVLRELRTQAEEALGEPITRAVVTVPAYFDDSQRQATRDAGTIAGLDICRILNEPTAAALAYGAHRVREGRRIIAVFDLGGGTFDISIMAVENNVFEVLATNGDSALGGDDWDRVLIDHWVDSIFDEHRVDLTSDPVAMGRLKEAAEGAKRALSSERTATIQLPYLHAADGPEPIHIERKITRDQFNALTADLLNRLKDPCFGAMQDAGLVASDIEEVLLVGGMSRAPAVQAQVEEIFQQPASKAANPDEVVALGAAAHAGILAGDDEEATLLDVAPHTIGIKVGSTGFAEIIKRNSMLPVREHKLFATNLDDQEFVEVEIYQGESETITGNRKLGQVRLGGLPRGKAGTVRIKLTVTVDVESILSVKATELSTGKSAQVRITASGGLSADDLEEIVEKRRTEAMSVPRPPEDD